MGQISKIKSITTKGKTLAKDGIDPFLEGKKNYENYLLCIETLAKERVEICKKCTSFKKEPVIKLRVKDTRIPDLSEMYCESCGCELPYKTRQNIKTCEKWLK